MFSPGFLDNSETIMPRQEVSGGATVDSMVISSVYDLLHPDGVNVRKLGDTGTLSITKPTSISNITKVSFRSFTGELLPFTNIELPDLCCELVLMSDGLKSATLTGNDTIDLGGVQTYDDTKRNVILSFRKAWTYNESSTSDSPLLDNIVEVVDIMNSKLKEYFTKNHYSIATYDQDHALSTCLFTSAYKAKVGPSYDFMLKDKETSTVNLLLAKSDGTLGYVTNAAIATDSIVTSCSYLDSDVPIYWFLSNNGTSHQYLIFASSTLSTVGSAITSEVMGHCFFHADDHDFNSKAYVSGDDLIIGLDLFDPSDGTITTGTYTLEDEAIITPIDEIEVLTINFPFFYNDQLCFILQINSYVYALLLTVSDLTTAPTITAHYLQYLGTAEVTLPIGRYARSQPPTLTDLSISSLTNPWIGYLTVASSGTVSFTASEVMMNFYYEAALVKGTKKWFALTTEQVEALNHAPTDDELERIAEWWYILPEGVSTISQILTDTGVYHPVVAYNISSEWGDITNQSILNADGLITTETLNVKCVGKNQSDQNVYLDPRNNDYLNTLLTEYLTIKELYIEDGVIKGSFFIPQIEFNSYVLNFNVKIYTDPFMFELYTNRDFDHQPHEFNFDVNETGIIFRASNADILTMIDQLILLKYNYNNVVLRVNGFPNSDGVLFNMNEDAKIRFKEMATSNATTQLIVDLIAKEDGETVPLTPELLQKLYGKLCLAIDWEG